MRKPLKFEKYIQDYHLYKPLIMFQFSGRKNLQAGHVQNQIYHSSYIFSRHRIEHSVTSVPWLYKQEKIFLIYKSRNWGTKNDSNTGT